LDSSAALNSTAANLTYTPTNGSFEVLVTNSTTGETTTSAVQVNLNGVGSETTLDDIVASLNAIDGISASVTANGKLVIKSTSSDVTFAFANDTSGALAALGVNTFFTGTAAGNIGVNSDVADDPSLLAASTGGVGEDTNNATTLAAFLTTSLDTQNGNSIEDIYDTMVADVAQGASQAETSYTSASTYQSTLEAQATSISGVNLDEEAVNLVMYQNAYAAVAKYITTLRDLFDILVQL
jgi:flagellar hook-associated protein 1